MWRPSWSCDLDHLYKLWFLLPKEAPHKIFALICQAVSGKKMFEHCGRRTDDGRHTTDADHGYTISSPCEPNRSGELKIKELFFKFSPINLLIILYQLTLFEDPSCYCFQDIMITNFQSTNLQREIIKKKKTFFIFTILSTHHALSADQV